MAWSSIRLVSIPLLLSSLAATCTPGPEPGAGDGGADAGGADGGGETRSFYLATAGIQAEVGSDPLFQHAVDFDTLAADSDVIEIHEEYIGIPWDAFAAGTEPPAEWAAVLEKLAADARATGKPIFLNTLIGREFLAPRAFVEGSELRREENWSARCYDFATATDGAAYKLAYSRYVTWMAETFEPRWMNVAIEINLFHQACPGAWDGMVDAERAAYEAVKAARPETLVFPSFVLGTLYGFECDPAQRQQCYDANYAAISGLERDRFAVSTYPYLNELALGEIPEDWFTRAADRGGETTIIAETGWNAVTAVGQLGDQCVDANVTSPDDQRAYLERLIHEGDKSSVEMVTWWSNSDLLPAFVMGDCPCDDDAAWCATVNAFRDAGGGTPEAKFFAELLFKIWGTMGLRDHDGAPRQPIYGRWSEELAIPVEPGL